MAWFGTATGRSSCQICNQRIPKGKLIMHIYYKGYFEIECIKRKAKEEAKKLKINLAW
jgi:hypothetical protein